jgi:hypothetical protein
MASCALVVPLNPNEQNLEFGSCVESGITRNFLCFSSSLLPELLGSGSMRYLAINLSYLIKKLIAFAQTAIRV